MRANRFTVFTLFFGCILIFSCKKQTEQFQSQPLSDYLSLQTGKYITYRTDSTVFTSFGTKTETHSYQEKQIVDIQTTDNLGRTSYRILCFLRDTLGIQPWAPSNTYFITPTNNTVEVIENNLRIIKLTLPIKQDNTWKGNRYLPTHPYNTLYPNWNNDVNMFDWDYTYSDTAASINLNGQTINNVLIVNGVNETTNYPSVDPSAYTSINFLQENYAKNIGLVYQEFIMWDYQPNPSGPGGYKTGFGVNRTMIDHN